MRAKDGFLRSATLKEEWDKIIGTTAYQTAIDVALLELVLEQPTVGTPEKGWDAHSQVVGARRFIEILSKLHIKEEHPQPMKLKNVPIPQ